MLSRDRVLIIGEIAQAHDGSLGMAHSYIDAVADAGADAVKFQTHIASAESTPAEPFRVAFSKQDASRYAYWRRLEFTEEQWAGLAAHAKARGLYFLSSPFSEEAVDLLERIGIPAWKVASGEISNVRQLDRMAATGKPILLSTGMSELDEVDQAVARARRGGGAIAVLQCTSEYPCPPERIGLNLIADLRERYDCYVGLSDHSGTIFPGIAGAAMGMDVLELHVTFSKRSFGPDVLSSVTVEELETLVQGIRFAETMRANPVDKNSVDEKVLALRSIFMKGLIATGNLEAGNVVGPGDVAARKPAQGISAARIEEVIGARLRVPVKAGDFLQDSDLETGG